MKLTTVMSGGQTGVDRAALQAARSAGLQVGGWCPPGRAAEDGRIPKDFPLKETPTDRSSRAPAIPRSLRTEWNVRDADATLVLAPREQMDDGGTSLTVRFASEYGRPALVCDPADEHAASSIIEWLTKHHVQTLNVAGPSESQSPGIGARVYSLLVQVFSNAQ